MKTKLSITVGVAILLACMLSMPAIAGEKAATKTYFAGVWCRDWANNVRTELPSGRVVVTDGSAEFHVTVDDPRVMGIFSSYNVKYNLSALGEGLVHADFMLSPAYPIEINDEIVWVANPDIDGVWEGKWKCLYRIEDDGCKYSTVTAEGQGMGGELEGLKIRVYVKAPVGTGAFCGLNTFWPFEGYILDPNN